MKNGYFVTGTDTGVGKTVVSAILCSGMQADYWKPVQTGTNESRDSEFLNDFSKTIFPEAYKLREPLSPHAAARLEGVNISLEKIVAARPSTTRPLIVEGAGGVLVPLNEHHLMIDLIQKMGLPAIIVSRSTLGTINHTLLTLEALRYRKIPIAGIVMVGPSNPQNREALEKYGRAPVVGEVFQTEVFSKSWMQSEFEKFALPQILERNLAHA
jgi:dethiobiotin synthetase/malonyl-CoA O-methyltransferase